jgi:hypothetical protein
MSEEMRDIVLRVSGKDLDVDALLARHPHVEAFNVFRLGEAGRKGKPNVESGFMVELGSGEAAVMQLLSRCKHMDAMFSELRTCGAWMMIHAGLTVSRARPMHSLSFRPDEIATFAGIGVSLRFSAYAASDDDG